MRLPTSIRMDGMSVRATRRAMIMAMAMMMPRECTNEKSAVAMARKAMMTVEALVATDSPPRSVRCARPARGSLPSSFPPVAGDDEDRVIVPTPISRANSRVEIM